MATLDDIAAETDYDKSTVSITLRNLPRAARFSEETRNRILAAADRLGYRPNFFARQLADKKPRLLMLCVNTLQDPFAMMVAEGFEARAGENDLRVLITALRDRQNPLDLHRDILGIQGIPALALVGGSALKLPDDSLRQLAEQGLKIMLVNRHVDHPNIGHVRANETAGGRMLAEHIYGQGLRDVWVLGGMQGPAFSARQSAILTVAAEVGAEPPRVLACSGPDWIDSAATVVHAEMQKVKTPPQAIISLSDVLALGASRATTRAGLVVGRDIAITGYDDGLYARSFWPPLTTVRLPMAGLGRHAADGLIRLLDNQPPSPEVVLPVKLIVRQSSTLAAASGHKSG